MAQRQHGVRIINSSAYTTASDAELPLTRGPALSRNAGPLTNPDENIATQLRDLERLTPLIVLPPHWRSTFETLTDMPRGYG